MGRYILFSLLLLAGLLVAYEGKAQNLCEYGSQRGSFTVTPQEGCAPLTVTVTNTKAGATNINWAYNYQGGFNPASTSNTSNTYTKAGTYTIVQVGSANGEGFTTCKEVKVLDTTPPNIEITVCADNKVRLKVVNDSIYQQYDRVEITWGDSPKLFIDKGQPLEIDHQYQNNRAQSIGVRGIYVSRGCSNGNTKLHRVELSDIQLDKTQISQIESRPNGDVAVTYTGVKGAESEVMVRTGGGAYSGTGFKSSSDATQQIVVPSLDPNQVHSIQIKTSDICGNSKGSNEAWTTTLDARAENKRNVLNWSKYPVAAGFAEYQVLRNGIVIRSYDKADSLSLVDTNVQCGEIYRYQVITRTAQVVSISAPDTVTAISNESPEAITQAFASVEPDGSVSVLAIPPATGTTGATTTYKLIIERAESGNGTFQELVALTNSNRYTDATAKTSERSYCYRISYENACGNRSTPTEPICTVWLQRSGSSIRWTSEEPFTDQINAYQVLEITKGGVSSETNTGLNTTFNPVSTTNEQELNYQVVARSSNGAFQSYSNIINLRHESTLFLPDAFSPNGDGQNDTFEAKGMFFESFLMLIYNRWGEVVYRSTDSSQGWDGMINGERAPEGSYIYRIEIKDSTSIPFVKSGSFLLLR